MSELDPDVMKRSLPADIHGVIDQVNANVDLAVSQIVDEFKANAKKVVTDFQNQNYTDDLKAAIQQHTKAFQDDLTQMDNSLASLRAATARAAELARKLDSTELRQAVGDLVEQSSQLQTKLKDFKQKTNDFGLKVGGAIATAAVKTFTGGVG